MCVCGACKCLDDCCLPLDKKAEFIACWTFVHGCVLSMACMVHDLFSYDNKDYGYYCYGYLIGLLHMLVGILMIYSVHKAKATLYLVSLILSSFAPFIFFMVIYLPLAQIFCLIIGCRYYSTVLK